MTITKIRLKDFKRLCGEARKSHECNIENGFDWITYRDELESALEGEYWKTSDEWIARQAVIPATYEEIYRNLSFAASTQMQFGATDEQVKALAWKFSKQGLSLAQCSMNKLTKQEARNILKFNGF